MKKVIFFPDAKSPHTDEVQKLLKKDYSCFEGRNTDEYSQVYFQSGHFALVFSDAKSALELLKAEATNLAGLKFKVYLFLSVNGVFNAEAQKKMKEHRINVYKLDEKAKLIQNLRDYMAGQDEESIAIEDIEFIMPKDD